MYHSTIYDQLLMEIVLKGDTTPHGVADEGSIKPDDPWLNSSKLSGHGGAILNVNTGGGHKGIL